MENELKPTTDKEMTIDYGGVQDPQEASKIFTQEEINAGFDFYRQDQTRIIKELEDIPTYNPKNFHEQFAFSNSKLYVNIDNVWVELGGTPRLPSGPKGIIGVNTIQTDTYVNDSSPTTCYGSSVELYVGNNPAQAREGISYVYKNLENLNGMTITSATLYFYVERYSEWTTKDIEIGRVTSSWNDSTTSWNTQPTASYSDGIVVELADTDTGWQSVDVTTIVQYWLNQTYTNYGLSLRDDGSGGGGNEEMYFLSSDNISNKPYILIA